MDKLEPFMEKSGINPENDNGTKSGIHDREGVYITDIVKGEERLKSENETNVTEAVRQELTEKIMDSSTINCDREDEAEIQLKENRYRGIIHLLERSRVYAAELNNQVKIQGMVKMRRKKNEHNIVNECNIQEMRECSSHAETLISNRDLNINNEIDFFIKTRKTNMGFIVSNYQPRLVEGGIMKDYQLEGVQWLYTMFVSGVNCILADEMGLGKTLQAIALICNLLENGICGPFLVIVPLSTISNWLEEFQTFAPSVPVLFFRGSKKIRSDILSEIMKPVTVMGKNVLKVVLISYEVCMSDSLNLSKITWHYIVVDEGHRLKNYKSKLSRVLREFKSIGKLLLTGTPLQNNLTELWSLLNFIVPEVFNSLEVFQSWFDIEQLQSDGQKFIEEASNIDIVTTLQQIIEPFLLRREKKDVSLKLPPKKEILVFCPMTALQKNLYESTVDRSIETLLKPRRANEDVIDPLPKRACVLYRNMKSLDNTQRNISEAEKLRQKYCSNSNKSNIFAWNIVMQNPQIQLRKIVSHPYLIQFPLMHGTNNLKIDEDLIKSSGKLLVVDAMLSKLNTRGHKVVIFSTFKLMLDILEDLADLRGYKYCRFDGSTKLEDRKMSIMEFNTNPDIFLFFVTIRAGGLGINLTGADTIIIYDSDWNPQINLQSQDRCHRIGQAKPVMVYKLCAKGTIDERIVERGDAKRRLEKLIIQKGKFAKGVKDLNRRLTAVDLQELKTLLMSTDYDSVIHSNGFVLTDEELEALLDRSEMTVNATNSECMQKENNKGKIFKLINNESDQ